ncbi:hypothetical protein KDJ21_013510 [Metabacillus litoralis]|uniref:hypothetical protein n=1 Tax=Metabacillus TaxID=2675233 RepID=UPI0013CEC9DE|nr:hypothetical protein [Metabacillus litoralis]UHA57907.1 hypothetical protein KDJ21_013510 [Metabacillus litoralis]
MTKKAWAQPKFEFLNINMTEAATYDEPEHDEAYNGDQTRRKPDGKLVPHHES